MTANRLRQILFTLALSFLFCTSIGAEPFIKGLYIGWKDLDEIKSPTKRFFLRHPYSEIYQTLKNDGFTIQQKKFYDAVVQQEERGCIGYHASSSEFRVFQDIVKMMLEEALKLEFKRDFHFFRLPGDSAIKDLKNADAFLKRFLPNIDDNIPEQRDQIVSTNYTLFSNYDLLYECSVYYFETSYSFKAPNFQEKVESLFSQLGIKIDYKVKNAIEDLFEIGEAVANKKGGTLFQFFDLSHQTPQYHNAYELVDRLCYPAQKKGKPVPYSYLFSDVYQDTAPWPMGDSYRQFRIVVNHFDFLNPYGSISIRRYDLNDKTVIKEYEKELRAKIRSILFDTKKGLAYDPLKADLYKKKLRAYWNFKD